MPQKTFKFKSEKEETSARQPLKNAQIQRDTYVFLVFAVPSAAVSSHFSSSSTNLFHLQSPYFFKSIIFGHRYGNGRTDEARASHRRGRPNQGETTARHFVPGKRLVCGSRSHHQQICWGGTNHCSRCEGFGVDLSRPDECLQTGTQAGRSS